LSPGNFDSLSKQAEGYHTYRQADCLRRYVGRYPGKDMPTVSNSAPGKGCFWKFPE
jgi:hypothetical protein